MKIIISMYKEKKYKAYKKDDEWLFCQVIFYKKDLGFVGLNYFEDYKKHDSNLARLKRPQQSFITRHDFQGDKYAVIKVIGIKRDYWREVFLNYLYDEYIRYKRRTYLKKILGRYMFKQNNYFVPDTESLKMAINTAYGMQGIQGKYIYNLKEGRVVPACDSK